MLYADTMGAADVFHLKVGTSSPTPSPTGNPYQSPFAPITGRIGRAKAPTPQSLVTSSSRVMLPRVTTSTAGASSSSLASRAQATPLVLPPRGGFGGASPAAGAGASMPAEGSSSSVLEPPGDVFADAGSGGGSGSGPETSVSSAARDMTGGERGTVGVSVEAPNGIWYAAAAAAIGVGAWLLYRRSKRR